MTSKALEDPWAGFHSSIISTISGRSSSNKIHVSWTLASLQNHQAVVLKDSPHSHSTGAKIVGFLVCTLASKCYLRGGAESFHFFHPYRLSQAHLAVVSLPWASLYQSSCCIALQSLKQMLLGTADLQRCVSFRCRAKWISHTCCCLVAKLYLTLLWLRGL